MTLNPIPNDKFWTLPNWKSLEEFAEFADDNFKFDENGRKFSYRVENTVGKGEISPFPTVFSKDLYWRHVKTRACLGKT